MKKFSIREYVSILKFGISNEDYNNIKNNKLFEILRDKGVFIEKDGFKNVPSDKVIEYGLFDYEKNYYEPENKWYVKPLITDKGGSWLTEALYKSGYIKTEVNFNEILNKYNNDWYMCDFNFLMNNILDNKYMFQYSAGIKNDWNVISMSNKIEVLYNIKVKGYKVRYNIIK